MTIFSAVVTDFLIQGIDIIITSSEKDDQSLLTRTRDRLQSVLESAHKYVFESTHLSFFNINIKRNLALSELKRNELKELKARIIESGKQDTVTNDSVTYKTLEDYFTTSELHIDNLCKEENKNEGTTGELLTKLSGFLHHAYKKICTDLKLSDIPVNTEALNCLQYHSANACTHYVFDERFHGGWQLLDYTLLSEKERIIMQELSRAAINVRPKAHSDETKALLIIDRAKEILALNDEANINHRFSIGGSMMIPDYLKQGMDNVKYILSCQISPVSTTETPPTDNEDNDYLNIKFG